MTPFSKEPFQNGYRRAPRGEKHVWDISLGRRFLLLLGAPFEIFTGGPLEAFKSVGRGIKGYQNTTPDTY